VKLTLLLQLIPKPRILELYLHSPMDNFTFYPWIGGWVSSRIGLEAVAKRTTAGLARNRILAFQPASPQPM
jgi:hypothetical protein